MVLEGPAMSTQEPKDRVVPVSEGIVLIGTQNMLMLSARCDPESPPTDASCGTSHPNIPPCSPLAPACLPACTLTSPISAIPP